MIKFYSNIIKWQETKSKNKFLKIKLYLNIILYVNFSHKKKIIV